eukprot:5406786-Pyramimonas_sp.AAC.1
MEVVTLLLRMRLLRRVRCVFDNFAGANPDAPTESEYIPLWVSARDGMTEVVESLVGTPPRAAVLLARLWNIPVADLAMLAGPEGREVGESGELDTE